MMTVQRSLHCPERLSDSGHKLDLSFSVSSSRILMQFNAFVTAVVVEGVPIALDLARCRTGLTR